MKIRIGPHRVLILIILFNCGLYNSSLSQQANDVCSSAKTITPGSSCTGGAILSSESLYLSTYAGSPSSTCYASPFDLWYTFTVPSNVSAITITLTPGGNPNSISNTNTFIEVFNASTCGAISTGNSLGCNGIGSPTTLAGLTSGSTYYFRVFANTNPNSTSGKWAYSLCVTYTASPSNDDCAGAITLTSSASCTTTSGTLSGATPTTGLPAGCEGAGTHYDVWYKYVATNTTERFTISSLGADITSSEIQLYSGTCGSLTSLQCGTTSLTSTSLTVGSTYYIRVSNIRSSPYVPTNAGFNICIQDPPSNDKCANAVSLTPGSTCTTTSGTIDLVTPSTSGLPVGCESVGTHYDVWYKFSATNATQIINLSSVNASFTNPEIQLYSGTCGAFTSLQCGTTSITATGLTVSTIYYVRVSNVGSPISNTAATFNICIQTPPSNDDCSGAISLTPGTSCSNTTGSLLLSTASTGLPAGCESGGTHYDVWYKFTAGSTYELVSISGLGSSFTNPEIQLYSGTCGSLTSLTCGTTSFTATGLTVGSTYYVRVSNIGSSPTSNGGFSICVYHPAAASVDVGKSYVNISKGTGGGTINPGDTLEIRSTLVIKSSALDSIMFLDTLRATGGLTFIPGSIALRTNEGKIYKSFTDAFDSDAGYLYTSGTDNVVRINMGSGASNVARGRLMSTSKPSNFGSTCIIMATYRVVVSASYNTTINVGGGAFYAQDGSTTVPYTYSFNTRNALVYSSPGLCPNTVAATNAIGGDFNGTFGTPSGSAPYTRNRGTSTNVPSYIYKTFATGQGPNDYYYGIANNTSATYTTLNTWAKTDAHRVFNVWDITGDHTSATNTSKGNPPCDTTQPMSATNPCGYMLVINSAYKTDTAFQYAVSNLCPNTYYEISAWYKNICSKCGCDSNGVSATGGSALYIPTGVGDSSGVQPNIAFDINGVDYYTTGNLSHNGITATQQGSDSVNTWVKRGFVYQTGPSQSSLTITMRNNAPGGGGNDWAMDDIAFATCNPVQVLDPTTSYIGCSGASATTFTDSVRAYFTNYKYVRWEKSCDNGSTWNTLQSNTLTYTAKIGNDSLAKTTYTFLPVYADSGCLVRVKTATTSTNLSNVNCSVVSSANVRLNISNCTSLSTLLIDFNGIVSNHKANLKWIINNNDGDIAYFIVQRSNDGINFFELPKLDAIPQSGSGPQVYTFTDPEILSGQMFYRLKLVSHNENKYTFSKIILLSDKPNSFVIASLTNPFKDAIKGELMTAKKGIMQIDLVDMFGKPILSKKINVVSGLNALTIPNLSYLSSGGYYLRMQFDDYIINRSLIKMH